MEHAEIVAEQASRSEWRWMRTRPWPNLPISERIPVRHREEVLIVPVHQIASIVADGRVCSNITRSVTNTHDHLSPQGFSRRGRPFALCTPGERHARERRRDREDWRHAWRTHVAVMSNGQKLRSAGCNRDYCATRLLKL